MIDHRLYMSVIGFSADSAFDATKDRPGTFGTLLVTLENRKCVSIALQDFHGFFDAVADKMREAIPLYTG